jgi:hypothetical protein
MVKFKKGDRVRVTSIPGYANLDGILIGDKGTVLEDGSEAPYVRMDKYNQSLSSACGLCDEGHGYALIQSNLELITEETMNSTSKYAVGDVVTDEYGTTGKIQAIQHRYQIQGSQYSWIDEDEIINKVEALEQDAIQLLKSRGYTITKIYDNE